MQIRRLDRDFAVQLNRLLVKLDRSRTCRRWPRLTRLYGRPIEDRATCLVPLLSIALERLRRCRAWVIVIPELEAAQRTDFIGRSAERVFVRGRHVEADRWRPSRIGLAC